MMKLWFGSAVAARWQVSYAAHDPVESGRAGKVSIESCCHFGLLTWLLNAAARARNAARPCDRGPMSPRRVGGADSLDRESGTIPPLRLPISKRGRRVDW